MDFLVNSLRSAGNFLHTNQTSLPLHDSRSAQASTQMANRILSFLAMTRWTAALTLLMA